MSKINLKKFSIYEFVLDMGKNGNSIPITITYKKDEENSASSVILAKYPDGKNLEIEVDLLTALHGALSEIDPYAFVFSNLETDKNGV